MANIRHNSKATLSLLQAIDIGTKEMEDFVIDELFGKLPSNHPK